MDHEIAIIGTLNNHTLLLPQSKAFIGIPGGYALYAAAGARLWGSKVKLVSRVGENYSRQWLDGFKIAGIDPVGVQIHPNFLDHRFFESYSDTFQRFIDKPISRFLERGVIFPKELFNYTYKDGSLPDTNTFPKISEIPTSCKYLDGVLIGPMDYKTQFQLVNLYRDVGITNIGMELDISYMVPESLDKIIQLIDGLEVVFIQEEHLATLFKNQRITRWAMLARLAKENIRNLIAIGPLNHQILYITETREKWILPPYNTQTVDPSGHKAAFCGAFMGSYVNDRDPFRAALCGNVAASICMETTGYEQLLSALPGLYKARLDVQAERAYQVRS